MALDGELWSGRDDFQKIVSIVRKKTPDEADWKTIKFMIFDAPLLKDTFEDRLITIKKELAKNKGTNAEMIK
jgi:DNA ligase-1